MRTDENFRSGVPKEYENKTSPLEGLGTSLIGQVPLDPMHLLWLGVFKKHHTIFLNAYGGGDAGELRKSQMSIDFCNLREWVPSEFGRKPTSFAEFSGFKASEQRMLGLYPGPILFNKYIYIFLRTKCFITIL